MSWCSANGICWGSCRSTWTTTIGPGPTYRWPRTHLSHGVCSRPARAVWWRCPAWVGSITNTSGEWREPIGRISGRHRGDAPAIVGEHNEDEEHPQASGRDREEIEGDQVPDVIGQERSPALRGRRAPLREQAGDGALGHVDAELQELAVDSGGTPQGIRHGHLCDKGLDLRVDWRGGPRRAGRGARPRI